MKKLKKFNKNAEIRKLARERIGPVKPRKVIKDKKKEKVTLESIREIFEYHGWR